MFTDEKSEKTRAKLDLQYVAKINFAGISLLYENIPAFIMSFTLPLPAPEACSKINTEKCLRAWMLFYKVN